MEWVNFWWEDASSFSWRKDRMNPLRPEEWFSLRDILTPRLWVPPPAAMETVVELFNDDRLARPHIPHVFAVPRLMTHLFRKALSKDADLMITIKAGAPFWPKSMHEPLMLFVMLPVHHHADHRGPWVLRGTKQARELEHAVEAGFSHPREH